MILPATFQHLPGVGPVRERALWKNGYGDWDALAAALATATPLAALTGDPARRRAAARRPEEDPRRQAWRTGLEESRLARDRGDWDYFLSRLPGREHWRVLGPRLADALYLDIETNGGFRGPDVITVVGVLFRGVFRAYVWPDSFHEVCRLVADAPLVVGFASGGFDLPVLAAHVPGFPRPRAHVDLLALARAAGIRGGLKGVERHYGIGRDDDVLGLRGGDAVTLWRRWRGGDAAALDVLLRYNRADVENLPLVGERLCRDLLAATPGGHGVTAATFLKPAAPDLRVVPEMPPLTPGRRGGAAGREVPVLVGVHGVGWARLKAGRVTTCRVPHAAARRGMTRAAGAAWVVRDAAAAPGVGAEPGAVPLRLGRTKQDELLAAAGLDRRLDDPDCARAAALVLAAAARIAAGEWEPLTGG